MHHRRSPAQHRWHLLPLLLALPAVLLTPLSPLAPRGASASSGVTVSVLNATFYANPTNSGTFDNSQLSSPVFTEQFPVAEFNPSVGAQASFCSNTTGVTDSTRPITDVVPNSDGTCSTVVAQGNGQQAGTGSLTTFESSMLATLTVPTAGNVTFGFISDDGWILGFGLLTGGTAQPVHVAGAMMNPPSATPVKGYPVAGAANLSPPTSGNPVTVYFPVSGSYPLELDYTECCGGPLALTMSPGPVSPAAARLGSDLWGMASSAGSAATPPCLRCDPVNSDTGNLVETAVDRKVSGRGRPLSLSRTYNTFDAVSASTPRRLGFGWTGSYDVRISFDTTTTPAQAVVHTEDGSTVRFQPGSGGYVPVGPWVIATLVTNPDGTYTYHLPDQTADRFNSAGTLLSESDRDGNVTSLAYDGSGNLSTVTDPAGRSLTITLGAGGLISRVTDPLGDVIGYTYDAAQNLASVTDADGSVTRYGYDGTHRLTSITRPAGGVTTNAYDAVNRVISQTDPTGHTTTLAYTGNATAITDPAGHVTVDTYQNDLLSTQTRGRGTGQEGTWTYAYDAAGQRTSVTDPDGHQSTYSYDGAGNLLTSRNSIGNTTTRTYSALNDLTSVTDPLGHVTSIARDAAGHVLSVSRTHTEDGQVATIGYTHGDPAHPGDVTAITDPDGKTSTLAYDAAGNLVRSVDPTGAATTRAYNAIGWPVSETLPLGNVAGAVAAQHTVVTTYDRTGDPLTVTDPVGDRTAMTYDADHNRATLTDANGHVTSYTFDRADRLTAVGRADGAVLATAYDVTGQVASQTDGLGHATTYTHDAQNRLASTTDALHRTTSYGYDGAGNRTAIRDPQGRTTTMAYDAADRMTGLSYSDGVTPNVSYTYNADGQRLTMTDGTTTFQAPSNQYAYDSLGRLVQTSGSPGSLGYEYDLAGHLTGLQYFGGVSRTYDDAGRMASITDWHGASTRFSYDPDGNMIGETYPNGVVTTMAYDNADRLMRSTTTGPGGTILDLPYARDPLGQVTSANATGTSPAVTQAYGYDPADRLTSAAVPGGSPSVPTNGYGYDAADHLTATSVAGLTTATLGYDAADQLLTSLAPSGQTTSYTYDPQGNRQTRTGPQNTLTTYSHDQANRLTAYAGPAANTINGITAGTTVQDTYAYDGDGLRLAKGVDGPLTYTLWDHAEGMPLLVEDLFTNYVTDPLGLPLEQVLADGTTLYYHHDQLGSTRALTDSHGLAVATYIYDPYGNALGTVPSVANPFRYAGQYQDAETGMYYLRARYYDPATGQFISRDPAVAQTRSAYGYVGESPLNGIDPSGLFCAEFWNKEKCDNPFTGAAVAFANSSAGERANAIIDRYSFGATSWIEGLAGVSYDHCSANWLDAHDSLAGNLASGVGLWTGLRALGAASAATGVTARIASLPAIGKASPLIGRGGSLLNDSDWFRIGWGWKGARDSGRDILRIGIGSNGSWWGGHIDLF